MKGGEWIDNGECYSSATNVEIATGCCSVYWGARQVCYKSEDVEEETTSTTSTASTTSTTSNSSSGQVGNKKIMILSESCADTENLLVKSEDGAVVYGEMIGGLKEWRELEIGIEISIRHKTDPYIAASYLTKGCSSGTNSVDRKYVI